MATTLSPSRRIAAHTDRTMNEYDVVVIGGGAAGLSAALVLTRARRRVAGRRRRPAAQRPGRPHAGLPVSRRHAARASCWPPGAREVAGYGGHLIARHGDRPRAGTSGPRFEVPLADGRPCAPAASWSPPGCATRSPTSRASRERWGRDLLHCPYCHGYEVRDQPLGVLGGTPEAVAHAQLDPPVVRTTSSSSPTAARSPRRARTARRPRHRHRRRHRVARLVVEDDRLTGVELDDGQVVPRTAVFVRPRFVPNDALLTGLGCATDDNGWVAVDATGAPACRASGPPATPSTHAPRSSPPPARAPPPPSPSTTTSSTRTSARGARSPPTDHRHRRRSMPG